MRISDEERREIAERLRVYSHDFDFSDSDPFWYVSKAAFGDVDAHTHCSVFARLADLIDRPTCKNLAKKPADELLCSRCGEHVDIAYVESVDDYHARYCPNCEAEVIHDA